LNYFVVYLIAPKTLTLGLGKHFYGGHIENFIATRGRIQYIYYIYKRFS